MSTNFSQLRIRGAFPPRTVAFCRGAVSIVLAALGMTALVLMLVALISAQSLRPGFAQAPERPAITQDGGAWGGLRAPPAR